MATTIAFEAGQPSARPRSSEGSPLRQPEYTVPPDGSEIARCVQHPQGLALRGIPVRCPGCGALRDWLLINQGRHVWIRCRCANQWLEPEIKRADFDALLVNRQWTTYPTTQLAMTALGFDSLLSGAYLPR